MNHFSDKQEFRQFCDFVMRTLRTPAEPNEPKAITEMRAEVERQFENAKALCIMFGLMDKGICYQVKEATDELVAMFEKQELEAAGKKVLN